MTHQNRRMVLSHPYAGRTLRHGAPRVKALGRQAGNRPIVLSQREAAPFEAATRHRRRRPGTGAEPPVPRMKAVPDTRDDVP